MICFSRQTQKEQAEPEAAEATQAKATQTAKEAAARAAQAANASQTPKAALGKPVTPTAELPINPSTSPGSDDFDETPRRRLNPHSLNYSSGRSTPPPMRARGRPHKDPQPPSEADTPIHGTKEELMLQQKKFNAATWRYKKLTSDEAESYCESENARVKKGLKHNVNTSLMQPVVNLMSINTSQTHQRP